MKNLFLLVVLFLLSSAVLADFKTGTDVLINGKKGSTADKILKLGNDFQIKKENGLPGAFSNDAGATWLEIGSGSGGAGGSAGGINLLLNSGADEDLDGYTKSGAGTFSVGNTALERINGENYFVADFSAASEYIETDSFLIPKGLRGRSCEAKITYHGGDSLLTFAVLDSSNNVLSQEITLDAKLTGNYKSAYFVCPSDAEITLHPERANLKIRISATGDAASITFDDLYAGTMIDLAEAVLPDTMAFRVSNPNGAGSNPVIASATEGLLDPVTPLTDAGTGDTHINWAPGLFTVKPAVTCTQETNGRSITVFNTGITSIRTLIERTTDGVDYDADFACTVTRQGVDAKQSVQIYKNIPTIADNINVFSAHIGGDNVVYTESADFIDGDCVGGLDPATCNFKAGVFTVAPVCTVTTDHSDYFVTAVPLATSVSIRVTSHAGSKGAGINRYITCTKSGNDFKLPIVQPIVVSNGMNIYTSIPTLASNVNRLIAKVSASGVVSEENANWIDGNCTYAGGAFACPLVGGLVTQTMTCFPTFRETTIDVGGIRMGPSSTSTIAIAPRDTSGTSGVQQPFNIVCEKNIVDRATEKVQPILIKQVETSVESGVRTESCVINNNGASSTGSSLCDSWVDSVSWVSAGRSSITVNAGIFSDTPVCVVSHNSNSVYIGTIYASSSTSIQVNNFNVDGGVSNSHSNIICTGKK